MIDTLDREIRAIETGEDGRIQDVHARGAVCPENDPAGERPRTTNSPPSLANGAGLCPKGQAFHLHGPEKLETRDYLETLKWLEEES